MELDQLVVCVGKRGNQPPPRREGRTVHEIGIDYDSCVSMNHTQQLEATAKGPPAKGQIVEPSAEQRRLRAEQPVQAGHTKWETREDESQSAQSLRYQRVQLAELGASVDAIAEPHRMG
jgi:hypothetical protein